MPSNTKLIIFIFALTFWTCTENKSEIKLIKQSDLNEIFSIGVPSSWHFQKELTEFSSSIIFSDTAKSIDEVLVFNVSWDSTTIFLNSYFATSIDSIARNHGHEPVTGIFFDLNNFNAYKFENRFVDTLNQLNFKETNYYLNKSDMKGFIRVSIWRNKEELTHSDSISIDSVLSSLTIE